MNETSNNENKFTFETVAAMLKAYTSIQTVKNQRRAGIKKLTTMLNNIVS